MPVFTHRLAQADDIPALRRLMRRAIDQLQHDFLTPAQTAASHKVMGLDTQLVSDLTYFIVEQGTTIVGCGGWSWRATLFGGSESVVARAPAPLDPATDGARIRAMYTDPDFTRQGVGTRIIAVCETAARAHGFRRTELMATLAGVPLYRAHGYLPIGPVTSSPIDGVVVPLIHMRKDLPEADGPAE